MKPLRVVHWFFGALVLSILLGLAAAFILQPFKSAEDSPAEAAVSRVQKKLEAYRGANGQYPDSLEALAFTNSPQEMRLLPLVHKMTYRRLESGYELSYGSFHRSFSETKRP